jgi:hypothetical protein
MQPFADVSSVGMRTLRFIKKIGYERRSRSRSLVIGVAAPVQLERPSMAGLFPRLLTQIPSRSHHPRLPSVAAQPGATRLTAAA